MLLLSVDFNVIALVFLPLYIIVAILVFLVCVLRRASNPLTTMKLKTTFTRFSKKAIIYLTTPALLLLVLLTFSFRGHEGPVCLSQLFLTKFSAKATTLAMLGFASFLFTQLLSAHYSTNSSSAEIITSGLLLTTSFIWATLVTNIITYIFFFEVTGLLILLIFIQLNSEKRASQKGLMRAPGSFAAPFATQNADLSVYIFFLWASAIAFVTIVWSLIVLTSCGFSLDLGMSSIAQNLFFSANTAHAVTNVAAFMLFLALSLKIAAAPFYAWLLPFYENLSLPALFAYFQLYYLYFLILIARLLCGPFAAFSGASFFLLTIVFVALVCLIISGFGATPKFKTFLALSSIINTTIVFMLLLL